MIILNRIKQYSCSTASLRANSTSKLNFLFCSLLSVARNRLLLDSTSHSSLLPASLSPNLSSCFLAVSPSSLCNPTPVIFSSHRVPLPHPEKYSSGGVLSNCDELVVRCTRCTVISFAAVKVFREGVNVSRVYF